MLASLVLFVRGSIYGVSCDITNTSTILEEIVCNESACDALITMGLCIYLGIKERYIARGLACR